MNTATASIKALELADFQTLADRLNELPNKKIAVKSYDTTSEVVSDPKKNQLSFTINYPNSTEEIIILLATPEESGAFGKVHRTFEKTDKLHPETPPTSLASLSFGKKLKVSTYNSSDIRNLSQVNGLVVRQLLEEAQKKS